MTLYITILILQIGYHLGAITYTDAVVYFVAGCVVWFLHCIVHDHGGHKS